MIKQSDRDYPGGPLAKTVLPMPGGLGLILGQGTRSHMLQLKILCAATKTWCSYINKTKTKWCICIWECLKAGLKCNIKKNEDLGIQSHHFIANTKKVETVTDFIFLDSKALWMVTAAMKLKDSCSLEGKL